MYKELSKEDQTKIKLYFKELNKRINLTPKDKKRINRDFNNIITYYLQENIPLDKALKLIDLDYLGNAYKLEERWYPLDTSSKIYPFSMNHNWMSTFRVSYYLKEDIIPEVLQVALNFTINRFPIFKTSIRRGLFWYYLDNVITRVPVVEENELPLSNINISKVGKVAFKVVYFRNRISCEFFHMLTDGTGGKIFTTTLVNEYIRLLGNKVTYNETALDIKEEPPIEETIDEFQKEYQTIDEESKLIASKALKIDGKRTSVGINKIIHYDLDCHKLHDLASSKNVTINTYLTAIIFKVLAKNISKEGDIKIQIPVNLRKYFASKTLRNFALYDNVVIPKEKCNNLDYLIKEVDKQIKEKLSKPRMENMLVGSTRLVNKLNLIPIFLKRPIAYLISNKLAEKGTTTVFSNLGLVDLPPSFQKQVLKGDFILGTTSANKELFSLITVNDTATFTMSKFSVNNRVELDFYQLFKDLDILIEIHGSDNYDNKA